MSSDTLGRLLRLLALLQTRRVWPDTDSAGQLEVTNVRRDVDLLRELGYPIDATAGQTGGYGLAGDSISHPAARQRRIVTGLVVPAEMTAGSPGIRSTQDGRCPFRK